MGDDESAIGNQHSAIEINWQLAMVWLAPTFSFHLLNSIRIHLSLTELLWQKSFG